ncbi:MAG: hypothetical protein E7571_04410 [Ruminococcaceae bacterium]|nr:hypothetical protein [Oscillospiraceae bacterium]
MCLSDLSYILNLLDDDVSSAIRLLDKDILSKITEIRIRKNNYLVLVVRSTSYFINEKGELSDSPFHSSVKCSAQSVDRLYLKLCDYSVYANTEHINSGFITLKNGARVGLSGTAVLSKNEIVSVKDIYSLNIRIPREVVGCSKTVLDFLYVNSFPSVIVAGMPSSGKTTLLRDMAYQLSSGFNDRYKKVAVIDERNEIAGKFGDGFMSVGFNTDVLSSFPKAEGIELATRTLSPDMIICDEVSKESEVTAVSQAFSSGVSFALSVHIGSVEDLYKKRIIRQLIKTGEFSYIILLKGTSYSAEIIDIEEVISEIRRTDSSDVSNFNGGIFDV